LPKLPRGTRLDNGICATGKVHYEPIFNPHPGDGLDAIFAEVVRSKIGWPTHRSPVYPLQAGT